MNDSNFDVQSMAEDYVHGLLTDDEQLIVREKIREDEAWRDAVNDARTRLDMMRQVSPSEASERLLQDTMRSVRDRARNEERFKRRLSMTATAALAACTLAIVSLNVYFARMAPTPYDLSVLGQSELMYGTEAALRVRLVNRATGEPMQNVSVTASIEQATGRVGPVATVVTDAHGAGAPRLRTPDPGDYIVRVTADVPHGPAETVTRHITVRRSWRLMLSTDKPVYQPGQTIHMRALALGKPDLKPVAGVDATFSVVDPRGNVVFKQTDVTSAYGIVAADCPTARQIMHGDYTLRCVVGDTESTRTVRVEPYRLPAFRIRLECDRAWYRPGDTIRGVVDADYFFGKPVAGGSARIELHAAERSMRRSSIQLPPITLDVDGRGVFEVTLPDDADMRFADGDAARVLIRAVVTDTADQEEERVIARLVDADAMHIQMVPESGRLVPGVPNTVYVFASYPDGRPVAGATVNVSGVAETLTTSPVGVAAFDITADGDARLNVKIVDADGRVGRRRVTLDADAPSLADDFLLRTDRAVYTSGDTLRLLALGGGTEPVFVDLLRDGQTIQSHSVAVSGGRGQLELDLPADLFGTLQVVGYRFNASGVAQRRSRTIYVRRATSVNVKAELDKPAYRPGGSATLSLTLTDDAGNPAPGAVSLAAVDEAVFAVMPRRPGMEEAFFTLDRELLAPVNEVYDHWTPRVPIVGDAPGDGALSAEQRVVVEQAMFARSATTLDELPISINAESIDLDPTHTLAVSSFPGKARDVYNTRESGLRKVMIAWWGMVLLLITLGAFWVLHAMTGSASQALAYLTSTGAALAVALALLQSVKESAMVRNAIDALAPGDAAMEIGGVPFDADPAGGLLDSASPEVRVRQHFPETLLWRPQIVTDDAGRATVDIPLADSITTWRVTGSAVTADGTLGAMQTPLRVFQPFFVDMDLPVTMTRGDEASVPVVVYNYANDAQTVKLDLQREPWFELIDDPTRTVALRPHEVRGTSFRIRVKTAGRHTLQVTARGGDVADAIRREIDVEPDGTRVEFVHNGNLATPSDVIVSIPGNAIDGSLHAVLKVYPSGFSQLVEGLDAIFARPSGCFEQTSSTTYPNVLALDYLTRTNQSVPQVEAKARQYIHLGYQRLLSFEVAGGGFDWYGEGPANVLLTAYGLMEFRDMAAVHNVDPNLIKRTRGWLINQRRDDGSWKADWHIASDSPGDADLAATAYVAWAIFGGDQSGIDADREETTWRYLTSRDAGKIESPHTLALLCNALAAMRPKDTTHLPACMKRLVERASEAEDAPGVHWPIGDRETPFYSAGVGGSIETTATALLAMMRYQRTGRAATERDAAIISNAMNWLIANKDSNGTWHTTQATVLALKALLAASDAATDPQTPRRVEVRAGGELVETIDIPADQFDVVQRVDLSRLLGVGTHQLTLTEPTETGAGFQIAARYHVPDDDAPAPTVAARRTMRVDVAYDRTTLRLGDTLAVKATVTNTTDAAAPMVIVDLPIPAGFTAIAEDLAALEGRVFGGGARLRLQGVDIAEKIERTPRALIVYLRSIPANDRVELEYRLRATTPVKTRTQPAEAYEYYTPSRRGVGESATLTVEPRA